MFCKLRIDVTVNTLWSWKYYSIHEYFVNVCWKYFRIAVFEEHHLLFGDRVNTRYAAGCYASCYTFWGSTSCDVVSDFWVKWLRWKSEIFFYSKLYLDNTRPSTRRHACMSQFCGSQVTKRNVGLFFFEDASLNFEDFTHLCVFLPSLSFKYFLQGLTKVLVIRDFASNLLC